LVEDYKEINIQIIERGRGECVAGDAEFYFVLKNALPDPLFIFL